MGRESPVSVNCVSETLMIVVAMLSVNKLK